MIEDPENNSLENQQQSEFNKMMQNIKEFNNKAKRKDQKDSI